MSWTYSCQHAFDGTYAGYEFYTLQSQPEAWIYVKFRKSYTVTYIRLLSPDRSNVYRSVKDIHIQFDNSTALQVIYIYIFYFLFIFF